MKDKVVADEVVTLESNVDHFLGPNLRLLNCTVVSNATAKNLFFSDLEMTGGVFKQCVRLENFHFEKIHFNKVKFCGEYIGCDFGDWDNVKKSSALDCDFTGANMEDCRFLNTDMRLIALPAWPHFSLHSPIDARKFVLSQAWPKALRIAFNVYTDTDPDCTAVVSNAELLAREAALPVLELKALLMQIPGIAILGK